MDAEGNTLDLYVCDFWKGETADKIFVEIEKSKLIPKDMNISDAEKICKDY